MFYCTPDCDTVTMVGKGKSPWNPSSQSAPAFWRARQHSVTVVASPLSDTETLWL